MKENYYLSHNTNIYFNWLEEYQDTDLLQLWSKGHLYCYFGHGNIYGNGCINGYSLKYGYGEGDGEGDGYEDGDGDGYEEGDGEGDGDGCRCGYGFEHGGY